MRLHWLKVEQAPRRAQGVMSGARRAGREIGLRLRGTVRLQDGVKQCSRTPRGGGEAIDVDRTRGRIEDAEQGLWIGRILLKARRRPAPNAIAPNTGPRSTVLERVSTTSLWFGSCIASPSHAGSVAGVMSGTRRSSPD